MMKPRRRRWGGEQDVAGSLVDKRGIPWRRRSKGKGGEGESCEGEARSLTESKRTVKGEVCDREYPIGEKSRGGIIKPVRCVRVEGRGMSVTICAAERAEAIALPQCKVTKKQIVDYELLERKRRVGKDQRTPYLALEHCGQ